MVLSIGILTGSFNSAARLKTTASGLSCLNGAFCEAFDHALSMFLDVDFFEQWFGSIFGGRVVINRVEEFGA